MDLVKSNELVEAAEGVRAQRYDLRVVSRGEEDVVLHHGHVDSRRNEDLPSVADALDARGGVHDSAVIVKTFGDLIFADVAHPIVDADADTDAVEGGGGAAVVVPRGGAEFVAVIVVRIRRFVAFVYPRVDWVILINVSSFAPIHILLGLVERVVVLILVLFVGLVALHLLLEFVVRLVDLRLPLGPCEGQLAVEGKADGGLGLVEGDHEAIANSLHFVPAGALDGAADDLVMSLDGNGHTVRCASPQCCGALHVRKNNRKRFVGVLRGVGVIARE